MDFIIVYLRVNNRFESLFFLDGGKKNCKIGNTIKYYQISQWPNPKFSNVCNI